MASLFRFFKNPISLVLQESRVLIEGTSLKMPERLWTVPGEAIERLRNSAVT